MLRKAFFIVVCLFLGAGPAPAGLYYSGEEYASLPASWRGFLLDHRLLRNIAVQPKVASETSPLRQHYLQEAEKLQKKKDRSADEWADLGALLIRLGEAERAVPLLRRAHQLHPNHFAILANLGTAWQSLGDLPQAALALEQAVRLAPGKQLPFEQAHLKLVRDRKRAGKGELDDLFGIQYTGEKGDYEAGKVAATQMKKLPNRSVAVIQQLALWLPADGPLLWQLAELANAHGDPRNAAAMMEGCVTQFGMQNTTLRKHRQILRAAVDELPALKPGTDQEHDAGHAGGIAFRSRRALVSKLTGAPLPPIDPRGINPIPWDLFSETTLGKPFKPAFPKYLQELKGKQISMSGFMYPLRDDTEMTAFLFIESPVGCWYCEMPETTGIVFVEMPAGQTTRYQRSLVRITGRLQLNATDPEEFLYTVKDARVGAID
jgi:hypothetical protein